MQSNSAVAIKGLHKTFGATLAILVVVPVLTAPDRTKDRPGRQDRFRATVSEVKRAAFAMFVASGSTSDLPVL